MATLLKVVASGLTVFFTAEPTTLSPGGDVENRPIDANSG